MTGQSSVTCRGGIWRREMRTRCSYFFSGVCSEAVRCLKLITAAQTFDLILWFWSARDWQIDTQTKSFAWDWIYSLPRQPNRAADTQNQSAHQSHALQTPSRINKTPQNSKQSLIFKTVFSKKPRGTSFSCASLAAFAVNKHLSINFCEPLIQLRVAGGWVTGWAAIIGTPNPSQH